MTHWKMKMPTSSWHGDSMEEVGGIVCHNCCKVAGIIAEKVELRFIALSSLS